MYSCGGVSIHATQAAHQQSLWLPLRQPWPAAKGEAVSMSIKA